MRREGCLLALLLACAACGEKKSSGEALQAKREAARSACISAQIAQYAEEQAAMLGQQRNGPAAAAAAFADAFNEHAKLRSAAYAQLDSALNHSSSPEDSARHARSSASVQINAPEANTVEANVIADYQRRFRAVAADADHPCNWQAEAVQ